MVAVAPALAQDDPAVVADAKAKHGLGRRCEGRGRVQGRRHRGEGGGVVAKAPCEPPPPPPPPKAAPLRPHRPSRARSGPGPGARSGTRSGTAPAPKELPASGGASLFALGAGVLLVAGGLWPAGSSARNGKRLLRGRGGAEWPRPFRRSELLLQASGRLLLPERRSSLGLAHS
jgi:hypothetical protein